MIDKFNINLRKPKNRYPLSKKTLFYHKADSPSEIREVLEEEAPNYVRKVRKIPDDKLCVVYKTKQNKIAVLPLDTPKKRLMYNKALKERINSDNDELMKELKDKYGFIPKPINVLRKYVDYGYMKSQDVEHLYHYLPVDFEIVDRKDLFEDAYRIRFDEKDVVAPGFNGYSCMSEEPEVGAFYYYFGAYMLLFYKKGTKEIVGRMVLWKWDNQLYAYKGYVQTQYQFSAREAVDKLYEDGTLKSGLPSDFVAELQRIDGKSPIEIYDIVKDQIRVPYIDEDLYLSHDKTELSYRGEYATKSTATKTLEDHGVFICEECGREICEDEVVEIGDSIYCDHCAMRCDDCEEWFAPDEDGGWVGDRWVCEDCLSEYSYCEECNKYFVSSNMVSFTDRHGDTCEVCEDCAEYVVQECDDCGEKFEKEALIEIDGKYYCEDCAENHKKEA